MYGEKFVISMTKCLISVFPVETSVLSYSSQQCTYKGTTSQLPSGCVVVTMCIKRKRLSLYMELEQGSLGPRVHR